MGPISGERPAQPLVSPLPAFVAHGLDAHDPAELRARDLTLQGLAATIPQNEIEERMREGSELSSEEAYRLALRTTTA